MSGEDLRPRPAPNVKGRDLGDEYIFLDASGDKLHVLNGAAREIFLMCDGARTLDDIAGAVAARYGIVRETALADARAAVHRLLELGLLVADESLTR